jgi:hypothetical protein
VMRSRGAGAMPRSSDNTTRDEITPSVPTSFSSEAVPLFAQCCTRNCVATVVAIAPLLTVVIA